MASNEVIVTFNGNGGNGTQATLTGDTSKGRIVLKAPKCTFIAPNGKAFKTWSKAANDEKATFNEGADLAFSSGITLELFAIWQDANSTDNNQGGGTTPPANNDNKSDAAKTHEQIALFVKKAGEIVASYTNEVNSYNELSALIKQIEKVSEETKSSIDEKLKSVRYFDFVEASNPALNLNPPDEKRIYLNSTTAEIFVCVDNTADNNVWVGSKQTIIGVLKPVEAGEQGFGVGIAPSALAKRYGLSPMPNAYDVSSENYGNYSDERGNVMVYIPKFYVKKSHAVEAPYLGLKVEVSFTPKEGFVIERAFINKGVEVDGLFIDKYLNSNENGVNASKLLGNPLSQGYWNDNKPNSNLDGHNPFAALNNKPLNNIGAAYKVVKNRHKDLAVPSGFIFTALNDLSDAHYQACALKKDFSACAYADVEPFLPKGSTKKVSPLTDYYDSSLSFISDGYGFCAKTGSANVPEKTSHNGQKSGVMDLNGNMWDIASGVMSLQEGQEINFYVLKESVDLATLTEASAYDKNHYDALNVDELNLNNTFRRLGNGTNKVFTGSTDRTSNDYKLDSLGLPKDSATSTEGSMRMGKAGMWMYKVANVCMLVGGSAYDTSIQARARILNSASSVGDEHFGVRSCFIPNELLR